VGGGMILKWTSKHKNVRVWSGFIWLRTKSRGWLLWIFDILILIYCVHYNWVDIRLQYTFTHKQYIEHHYEREYLEQNIHNNKNT
jgi:hypothetical protein